jgi:hypothetical protein
MSSLKENSGTFLDFLSPKDNRFRVLKCLNAENKQIEINYPYILNFLSWVIFPRIILISKL